MKTLLLMRHAKTESPYTLKRDFDRILTDKGERDAVNMGKWLQSKGLQIDRILSSPAARTRQTTELVAAAIGLAATIIEFNEELYHASPEIFFQLIAAIPSDVSNALIVSHNDGITHFANQLTTTRIDHMQPGSVFTITCTCSNWTDFSKAPKTFLYYRQPD